MAAGFGLRRVNKLSEGTVAQMNKIIYSFCFPFVLFHNVYGVDIASAMNGPFLAVIAGMVVLVTALLIVFILQGGDENDRDVTRVLAGAQAPAAKD